MTLTVEQLKIRKEGVTGSEIAAVAGINPWNAAVDVWNDKMGYAKDDASFHTERGTFLEEGLIRWLEHRMGYEVREVGTVVHPEIPFVIATPDGTAFEWGEGGKQGKKLAAVEIKSPSFRTADHWSNPLIKPDGIPYYYIPQVMWECAVLGVDRCDVAALIDEDLSVYTVPFNQELFNTLVAKADRFMQYVRDGEPPPVDGTDSASEWLKKRFPEHIRSMDLIASNGDIEDTAHHLKTVMEQIKELEGEKALAQNQIKEFLKGAPGLVGEFGKIYWKKSKDSYGYDKKGLIEYMADHHPDVLARYGKTSPGPRVFRPYWYKEK